MNIPQIVSQSDAKTGDMGQQYLATGKHVALRRWREEAGVRSEPTTRDYETVGYLVHGCLDVEIDGEKASLVAGDSWLIPQGAQHRYQITESIVAIEATTPPARFNERDLPNDSDTAKKKESSR